MIGDLPEADAQPPPNMLFICKLNPVTTEEDLEIIFSRFGNITSCDIIRCGAAARGQPGRAVGLRGRRAWDALAGERGRPGTEVALAAKNDPFNAGIGRRGTA